MQQYLSKINFVAFVGAFILFLMPWINIQCNERVFVTQTGLQTVYGGASLAEDLPEGNPSEDKDKGPGSAFLVTLAMLTIIGGVTISGFVLFKDYKSPINPGILATAALALILLQSAVGFPITNSLNEAMNDPKMNDNDRAMMMALMKIESKKTGWYYLELILLVIPAGLYLNGKMPEKKPQTPEIEQGIL